MILLSINRHIPTQTLTSLLMLLMIMLLLLLIIFYENLDSLFDDEMQTLFVKTYSVFTFCKCKRLDESEMYIS